MRKRRIAIALLSFAFIGASVGLSSCGGGNSSNVSETGEVNFDVQEGTKFRLNQINIDTTNTQTVFYVGDKFNYDNLIVNRTFLRITDDSEEKILQNDLNDSTKVYSVDYSEVDMNHIGTYFVYISVRYGDTVRRDNYKVQVLSSKFETTPNLEYNAGLSVKYSDDTRFKEYLIDDEIDVNDLVSGLKFNLIKRKVNADGTSSVEQEPVSLSASDVEVDSSSIDSTEVGTYMIKVKYKGQKLTIDGKEYDNDLTSYVLVNVINPVTSIKKVSSGDNEFPAQFNDLDLSGWLIEIKRERREAETVNFSYDLFDVSGISPFVSSNQTAHLVLKEDTTQKLDVAIKVKASTEYNIVSGYSFTRDKDGTTISSADSEVVTAQTQLDASGYFYAKDMKRDPSKTCKADGLSFSCRITMKGATFDVKMPKAGKIIIYATSTDGTGSDVEREVAIHRLLNDDINYTKAEFDEEYLIDSKYTDSAWANGCTPTRLVFDVEKPGIYQFTGNVYIVGAVAATLKD